MKHTVRGDVSIPIKVTRMNKKATIIEEKNLTVKVSISIDIPKALKDASGKSTRQMRKEIKRTYESIADLMATHVGSVETVAIDNSDMADDCSKILYDHIDLAIQETTEVLNGAIKSNVDDESSASYG